MTNRLVAVAQAHREALAEEAEAKKALAAAKARRAAAGEKVTRARAPLAEEIVKAAKAGMRQVEIVAITGYNRERIRQICRAAGVEPPE